MPKKKSSNEMSALAGKWMKITGIELSEMVAECNSFTEFDNIASEIRQLAASVLSQDETRG